MTKKIPLNEKYDLEFTRELNELHRERLRRLNEVITANSLTLEALESKIGVAKSSIQRYLTGQTMKIPIDFFDKISRITNTPVEYLACYDTDNKKTTPEDIRSGIGTKVSELSDSQLDRLIGYLDALKAE